MVRDTSLIAYLDLQATDKLGEYQTRIYELIKTKPNITDKEMSELSQIPINNVTGRRNELVKMELVTDNGKRHCDVTGRLAYQWILK